MATKTLKFTNHSIDSSGDEVCRWREIIETRAGFCTVITSEYDETVQEDDVPTAIAMERVVDWDKADIASVTVGEPYGHVPGHPEC